MKLLDVDWVDVFRYAPTWDELSERQRGLALHLRRSDTERAEFFGEDLAALESAAILERYGDGERVRPCPRFCPALRVLRFMARVPVLRIPERGVLEEYLRDVLTREEREGLADNYGWGAHRVLPMVLTDRSHVDGFLASDPAKWEKSHEASHAFGRPREHLLADPVVGKDLKRFLRWLLERTEPAAVADLGPGLGRMSARRRADAILAGLRYGLFLAGFDDHGRPAIGLWPPLVERLHRAPTPPPAVVEPDETVEVAWALEDLVQLLVFCAEPRRIRASDRGLFVKAQRELEGMLAPLPGWLVREGGSEARVRLARALAEEHGLVAVGRGARATLQTSGEGREWLALTPRERALRVLSCQRLGQDEDEESPSTLYGGRDSRTDDSLVQACESLAAPVRFVDFIEHQVHEANPLLQGDGPRRRSHYGVPVTEEALEEEWSRSLRECVLFDLAPYGGIEFGLAGDDLTIRLTDVGRYLLRLTETLEWPEAEESGAILVQPDFEIVFLEPNPSLEAVITRFAERRGTGVGALFRITRSSIQSAARAGLGPDEITAELERHSKAPVPDNVAREIDGWASQTVHLAWQPASLLRCADEETAARIHAASKGKLEVVGPTVLALTDPAQRTRITASLRKAGIFLDVPEEEERRRPERSRRRRRGW